jgi:hypothetical protein
LDRKVDNRFALDKRQEDLFALKSGQFSTHSSLNWGDVPATMPATGGPGEVIEYTKKLIDMVGEGVDSSYALDVLIRPTQNSKT